MFRLLSILSLTAMLSVLIPQTASAAPTLEWDGQSELRTANLGVLGPAVLPYGAQGDKVAKNIGQGIKGGLYLGVGIPIAIVGGIFTGLAINFFVVADLALAGGEDGADGVAFVSRVVGLVCLIIGISALSSGAGLIIKGVKALSKISADALTGPDPRMARAEKNRARWGMHFALAGVPTRR